ncbi:phenylacetic acid degradation protein [Salipaludibacillus keqinensis]|uniref:Phenylacetic acid degradation protein n=1 Tax=Salipaludibacillus keqinensis TaxID=2045207 RepID=A0A323TEE1_9BACI|nr:PaaI family thioesterase [Salipaludibacillus keqinensis]PYZ92986.1 phenylacetic acid degradation protein [Salipaludibacillus keqinensis]
MTVKYATLEERFNASPFFAHLGFKLLQGDKDGIVLELPIKKHLINTNGTVHGGVYATMLDNIMSISVRDVVNKDIVTVNLNVNYFAAIQKGVLIGKAKILQQGYRIVTCEGEVTNEEGDVLAKATGVFKVKHSTGG